MLQIEFCQNCEVILDILPYEHPTGVLFFVDRRNRQSTQPPLHLNNTKEKKITLFDFYNALPILFVSV